MELVKKQIQVNQGKCCGSIQLTLDDDFNVPDRKPDVRQIVAEQGEIRTNEITPMGDRVQLDGVLQFQLLYVSDQQEGRMQGMKGEIPFQEWVNLPEACQGQVLVRWMLEDLSVEIINSRKISVRAIVSAWVQGEDGSQEELAVDLIGENGSEPGMVQSRKKRMSWMQQKIAKKDTFRIKDEYILPAAKPDMEEIAYGDVSLRGVEVRALEDSFGLKGELHFMIFYYGGDTDRLQYLELQLPFAGTPECIGYRSDMIPDVEVHILKKDIQIKPDEDGEERILDIEVILDLTIRAYGEEEGDVLEDFYALDRDLRPTYRELVCQELKDHHSTKLRLNQRVAVPESSPAILQLCGSSAVIRVDESVRETDGIRIEGVVELPILYITAEDAAPLYMIKGLLPFEEYVPQEEKDGFSTVVKPVIDQVALSLLDSRDMDVKVTMNLDVYLFGEKNEQVIGGYTESEITEEELLRMPGITGYYVQEGDSWWTVGKKYRIPVDNLRRMNDGIPGELESGMRLLIRRGKEYGRK